MVIKYALPVAQPAPVLAAPARLAEGHDGATHWRERVDGRIEVAILRKGWLHLHLVEQDGSTTVTDQIGPSFLRLPGTFAILVGVATSAVCLAWIVASGVSAGDPDRVAIQGYFASVALAMIGGVVRWLSEASLHSLPNRRWFAGPWHEPVVLSGWAPASGSQFAAVEQLTHKHKGISYVREIEDDSVEVLVRRRIRFFCYSVDIWGQVTPPERMRVGPAAALGFFRSTPKDVAGRLTEEHEASTWHEVRTQSVDQDL